MIEAFIALIVAVTICVLDMIAVHRSMNQTMKHMLGEDIRRTLTGGREDG